MFFAGNTGEPRGSARIHTYIHDIHTDRHTDIQTYIQGGWGGWGAEGGREDDRTHQGQGREEEGEKGEDNVGGLSRRL